jgi:hypothetical protein
MCVYNTHARSSADSFAVGSGVWSVLSCFHWIILGPSGEYYSPRKDTLRAGPPNILAAKIFAYTVDDSSHPPKMRKIKNIADPMHNS